MITALFPRTPRLPGALATRGLAVVLAGLALAGCAPDETVVVYRLAEYLEAFPPESAGVRLIPAFDPAGRLVEGFSPAGDGSEDRWAEGRAVHAEFDLAFAQPTSVLVEARPYSPAGAPAQSAEVRVNGTLVGAIDLDPRWGTHRVEIPEEAVRRGPNDLQLLFDHALVPAREEGGDDRRQLAARIARLEIGDPFAVDAPPAASISVSEEGGGEPETRVELAAGALAKIWLEVPAGAELLAGVAKSAPGEAPVESTIWLEDEAGEIHSLHRAPTSVERRALRLDLAPWSGQVVRLLLGSVAPAVEPRPALWWFEPRVVAPSSSVPAAALVGAEPEPGPAAEFDRPDIFVVVLDAARADAFSPWGASRPTPAVQALADSGTVFANAYSSAPWTGQAIPGIFSGRYPEGHGVETWGYALPASIPSMAEVVGRLGYHTVLWTQHAIYSGNRTLRRGFDEFVEAPEAEPGVVPAPADLFLDDAPTFAVLHWLPPHGPYAPPDPFRGRYSDWQQEELPINARFLNRFPRQQDPATLAEEHVRYVRDRYDEHVAYADDVVGRFVEMLRSAGRYEDALIVVTSDHGEGFLEHGWFLHTRFLYEEVLRVPLLIKWPAGIELQAPRVSQPVSTIQLLPTLVDALGVERDDLRHQAGSLLPLTAEGAERPDWVYFSSRGVAPPDRDPRPLWGLRVGRWKSVYWQPDDRIELYDLEADPDERNDLAGARPRLAAFLHQQASLQRRRGELLLTSEVPGGEAEQLSPETVERLRALGYIQ